jgi:hypothetical protein
MFFEPSLFQAMQTRKEKIKKTAQEEAGKTEKSLLFCLGGSRMKKGGLSVGTKGRGVERRNWTDGHDECPRCLKWANFNLPAHAVSYPAVLFFSSALL